MKKVILGLILGLVILISCNKEEGRTSFSEEALQATVFDLKGKEVIIEKVLEETKGKTTFIDLWASWCGDCIKGIPKVKALQEKYDDKIVYVFLSLDKDESKWKAAIDNYGLKGNHYWFKGLSDWKTHPFTKDIDLDWIPRYMIIGKDGSIKLFRAIKADDPKLIKAIDADLK